MLEIGSALLFRSERLPARGVIGDVRVDLQELARLLGENTVVVGPMDADELGRAIELPGRRAGLVVEPELRDALVAEVVDQPGALPLLSTKLRPPRPREQVVPRPQLTERLQQGVTGALTLLSATVSLPLPSVMFTSSMIRSSDRVRITHRIRLGEWVKKS